MEEDLLSNGHRPPSGRAGLNSPAVKLAPWILAAVALVFFLMLMARTVTPASLGYSVKMLGADWRNVVTQPLFVLLTLPLRYLPAGWQVLGTHLFSALCAVGVLWLLARAVVLLPQDRTMEQRRKETGPKALLTGSGAWVPPVLAVVACALQRTFLENAVAASSEMLDLLLFAYVVRNLLEFRVSERESWLYKAAFVLGVGMTNNWGMIGFAPVFALAVLWLRGLAFFRYQFLMTMLVCVGVGLSLYLFLPLFNLLSSDSYISFFAAFKANFMTQRYWLQMILAGIPKVNLLAFGAISLLPLLLAGIRWPTTSDNPEDAYQQITSLVFYLTHAFFAGICAWVLFDPLFSPREKAYSLQCLPIYFLAALSLGYLVGYFIVVFDPKRSEKFFRPGPIRVLASYLITAVAWAAPLALAAGLVARNWHYVRAFTDRALDTYTTFIRQSLPAQPCVLYNDDTVRYYALRLTMSAPEKLNVILIDSESLADREYHNYLARTYAERWRGPDPKLVPPQVTPSTVLNLLSELIKVLPVYYSHPSFGYYFERIYLRPAGMAYITRELAADFFDLPSVAPDDIVRQEKYWREVPQAEFARLQGWLDKHPGLHKEYQTAIAWVARFYSKSLNDWGVRLNRSDQAAKAVPWFAQAMKLNAENPVAAANYEWVKFNQDWIEIINQGKTPKPFEFTDETMAKLNPYKARWDIVNREFGPFDQPDFLDLYWPVLFRANLSKQAIQELDRVIQHNTNDITKYLSKANLFLRGGYPERAEKYLQEFRATGRKFTEADRAQMDTLEGWSYFLRNDTNTAVTRFRGVQERNPYIDVGYLAELQIYFDRADAARGIGDTNTRAGAVRESIAVLNRQLKYQPTNASIWINLGAMSMTLKEFPKAETYLNRAVELAPDYFPSRLNRAIARLQMDKMDEARADYKWVVDHQPNEWRAYYGLADIAYRKEIFGEALDYYEQYLKFAPQDPIERPFAIKRVEELKKKKL